MGLYIFFLICFFQRNSAGSENPSDSFRFLVEERVQCCQTRRVRYTQRVDYCIQLPAPIEAATNRGTDSGCFCINDPFHQTSFGLSKIRKQKGMIGPGLNCLCNSLLTLYSKIDVINQRCI